MTCASQHRILLLTKKVYGADALIKAKGKGAKVETKEESIQSLKGIMKKLDPSFFDKDEPPKNPSEREIREISENRQQ